MWLISPSGVPKNRYEIRPFDILDCSQSPIFPFDRRDRAQTFTILVLKSERELGRAI